MTFRSAKMMEQVPFRVEFENIRGRDATLGAVGLEVGFLGLERAWPMNDPDVIVRIDGQADGLADDPMIRQRLGPERIHFEPGRHHGAGMNDASLAHQDRPRA